MARNHYSSDEGGCYSSEEENIDPIGKRKCAVYSSDEEFKDDRILFKRSCRQLGHDDSVGVPDLLPSCPDFSSDEDFFMMANTDCPDHDEEDMDDCNRPLLSERTLNVSHCKPDNRQPRKRMKKSGGRLESKETSIDTVHQIKDLRCCRELCLEKLDVKTIGQARRDFYMKKQDEQTEFIFSSLRCSYAHVEKGSKVTFVAFGVRLCQTGWRALHGIKPRRYRIIKAKVKEGYQSMDTEDGRSGLKYASEMYLQAKTYVETTAVRYGDQQPDCREVHLPCCLNKTIAYEEYQKTFQDRGLRCVSKRSFYRIWREHFNNVKIRKFQKFSKCNECTTFRDALSQKLTKEERLRLQAQRQIHLKFQELSREKYYKHRSKSRVNPAKYISLIIDNMDQSKTNLPRFPENFKSETGLMHIHHHVTGVLNHGINKSYVYTWTDQFSSDCNITLNCLMLVLKDAAMINNGSLPPVLYLQADNSPKDNKNKFVIMFLAMLVKANILKKEQYKTIFLALNQMFKACPSVLKKSQFINKMESMTSDKPANQSELRREFQTLLKVRPSYTEADYKLAIQAGHGKRSPILPLDRYSLFLSSNVPKRGAFINAVTLPSYVNNKAFIVTHYPPPEDAVDFLRLLTDHECKVVICVDPLPKVESSKKWMPDINESKTVAPFTVYCQKKDSKDVKYSIIGILQGQNDESYLVSILEPTCSLMSTDQGTSQLLKLVSFVMDSETEGPVTVVSSDGAGLCEVFCAVYNEVQQLSMDEELDIFSAVRQLQIRRPELCSSMEEYRMIHTAILEWIREHQGHTEENIYYNQ